MADYTSALIFDLSLINLPLVILKDKALLESTLSVRVMPRHKAQEQRRLSLGHLCFGR